jgi:hypothetical protein
MARHRNPELAETFRGKGSPTARKPSNVPPPYPKKPHSGQVRITVRTTDGGRKDLVPGLSLVAAVPVLVTLLRDARPSARRYGADKLGETGPPARAADGFDWSVRATATWALSAIDPTTAAQARASRD